MKRPEAGERDMMPESRLECRARPAAAELSIDLSPRLCSRAMKDMARIAAACLVATVGFSGSGRVIGQELFSMRVVVSGLDAPWEITWGPIGSCG